VTRKTRRELEYKRNILVFSGSQARSSNYIALVTFLSKANLAGLEHTELFILLEIWSGSLRHGVHLSEIRHWVTPSTKNGHTGSTSTNPGLT
jgi:hypothetical protein